MNLTPHQQKRLNALKADKPSLVPLFERLWEGKGTRSQAIKAQCLDCNGLDVAEVRACAVNWCPLWHFRPFAKHKREGQKPRKIPAAFALGRVGSKKPMPCSQIDAQAIDGCKVTVSTIQP